MQGIAAIIAHAGIFLPAFRTSSWSIAFFPLRIWTQQFSRRGCHAVRTEVYVTVSGSWSTIKTAVRSNGSIQFVKLGRRKGQSIDLVASRIFSKMDRPSVPLPWPPSRDIDHSLVAGPWRDRTFSRIMASLWVVPNAPVKTGLLYLHVLKQKCRALFSSTSFAMWEIQVPSHLRLILSVALLLHTFL